MHRLLPLVFIALIWAACDAEPAGPEPNPALEQAAAAITAADVERAVAVITHDSMVGRDTPSPGLEAAASYLAGRFQAMGLQAAGTEGYYQRYLFTYPVRDGASVLLELDSGGPALEHGRDYLMLAAEPQRGDAAGPMLWGGRADSVAISTLPVAGGVVFFDLPVSRFDLEAVRATSDASYAVERRGGAAIGFVVGPDFSEEAMARAVARSERHGRWIPQFWIREAAAESLLAATGNDLGTLRDQGAQPLGDSIRVRGVLEPVNATPPNVVALLSGSDPARRDEYVVVSAHYDHIGVRFPDATGDSVYNGADDNASGTVAVLELAEALATLETPPARSVVFLLVSGEEYGLHGSAHFARDPTVPLSGIVANLNLDMVGRNDPGQVIGIGHAFTSLGPLADSLAEHHGGLGLDVVPDPVPEENLFMRSDQLVFACRDVPALFLHTGLHGDYHAASDELERLDTDKVARIARLGLYLTWAVGDAAGAPTWTVAGRQAIAGIGWCP